jgi:hypothetical protein
VSQDPPIPGNDTGSASFTAITLPSGVSYGLDCILSLGIDFSKRHPFYPTLYVRILFLFVIVYPDTMIWIPYLTGVNWRLTASDCAHRRLDVPIRTLIAELPRVALTVFSPLGSISRNDIFRSNTLCAYFISLRGYLL